MERKEKEFKNNKQEYTNVDKWSHDILLLLMGVILRKLDKKLTPYTIFGFVMIINSLGWLGQMIGDLNNYSIFEVVNNAITQLATLSIAFCCIIAFKTGKTYIYRLSSLVLCVFCAIFGMYWFIIDLVNFNGYSTTMIIYLSFLTDGIRGIGGLILLLNFNESDFQ